ncbi:MAG: glutamate racemase [Oscillospiraceae bacterium]
MDQRPIGVFDSGLGGLTAVREMRRLMPSENIIYFGDTSRVPYGGRSPEILLKYARQDVHFLRSFDIKAVLVACGTVSTTALPQLQAENDLPILGWWSPPAGRRRP